MAMKPHSKSPISSAKSHVGMLFKDISPSPHESELRLIHFSSTNMSVSLFGLIEVFLAFDPIATSELTNRQNSMRSQPHYYLCGKTKSARRSDTFTKNSTLLLPSFFNCSSLLSVYRRWLRKMKAKTGQMN
ncbi:hypothetical protein IGI04_013662 [Brassica rapa subsp. trilocularis]|uniref:Uncharacterized protein n=1 Tax=Brassica rapa subsp. trilocularis TaxID=1813537 RepID=A0ABQ7N9H1_BRACM|nr:hypothetical protein IGI04_013662 [Brassica rapa subsp. trilocularis]